ncbi:F-box/LRR-repeat protein 20-like isoform X1 [Amphibalanus amphitrite]|uniref:F-box/LRR-repeat protein 20-like isoform X1 n=2 Tax=Amphibalanus amphitrite TaxID=1232801 RepID=UPI001C91F034|nr:F-box/LRR-repeat protein 20-like isoform X1 [Amphibalanus amphitrite]
MAERQRHQQDVMPRRRRFRHAQHRPEPSADIHQPALANGSGTRSSTWGGGWPESPDNTGDNQLRLCVRNLPRRISKRTVFHAFEDFGFVKDVTLVRNKESGRLRDFCFVTFTERNAALGALEAASVGSVWLGSRLVTAEPARPRRSAAHPPQSLPTVPASPAESVTAEPRGQRRRRRRRGRSSGACHADRLPAELLEQILSLLPLRYQLIAQAVSRRWHAVVAGLLARRAEILLDRDFADAGERVSMDSEQMRSLLRQATGLRRLHTGPAHLCPFDAMDHITAHCPNLLSLDMSSGFFTFSQQRLRRLVRACPLLEDVTLPSYYVCDEATVLVLLRHLPRLRRLQLLPGTQLTGQSLALLPGSLRQLSLPCGWLSSEHVRHVARCRQLRELELTGVARLKTADLAAALAGCRCLERLSAARLGPPPQLYLPPEGLARLVSLDVSDAPGVTDETLRRLPELAPALTALNVQGCDGVTESGLTHLDRLCHLQSLDVGYVCDVTDHVLYRLRALPLRELRLAQDATGSARFTETGVVGLAVALPSLALLDLSCVDCISEGLVERLESDLPDGRSLGIYVGGTSLERYGQPTSDRVRLLRYITVPGGRRLLTAEQLWNESEEAEVPTIADWRRPPCE